MAGTKHQGPFVVAYGEEDYLLDRVLNLGKSWKDRFVVLLDGCGLSDYALVSACEQECWDGRERVIVVDNAEQIKGEKALTAYIENKAADDLRVVLVAVLRTNKLPKVWQMAAAKGRQDHFEGLKPWQTDEMKKRIFDEAQRMKLGLDDDVPETFLTLFGDNLRRTANELQKLSYIAVNGRVTKQDVVAVVHPDVPVDPFEVAQAALNKEPRKALRLVSTLFKNLGDEAAYRITAGLLGQVEKLIMTRQMLDSGVDAKTIAEALGIPPFPVQKEIIPRARKHTVSALLCQMKNLCKLDALVKGAARSKRTLVELAVLSVAA